MLPVPPNLPRRFQAEIERISEIQSAREVQAAEELRDAEARASTQGKRAEQLVVEKNSLGREMSCLRSEAASCREKVREWGKRRESG